MATAIAATIWMPVLMQIPHYRRHQQRAQTHFRAALNQIAYRIHHTTVNRRQTMKGMSTNIQRDPTLEWKEKKLTKTTFPRFISFFPHSMCSTSTTNAELRRRKRQERQSTMEEKIKDIKRKQKAYEAAAEAAPKKRRSLLILSGVVVCALCCAYIYTKFG